MGKAQSEEKISDFHGKLNWVKLGFLDSFTAQLNYTCVEFVGNWTGEGIFQIPNSKFKVGTLLLGGAILFSFSFV